MAKDLQVTDSINVPALSLSVSVLPDATTEHAVDAVDAVCGALLRQEASVEHLRILLGRLMVEIKVRRLFRPAFRTFEAFTTDVLSRNRISRTTLRDSITIVRRLPMLEPEAAEAIPITNITLAARAAKGMQAPVVRQMLRSAAKMNVIEFRAKLESDGAIPKRGAVGRPVGRPGIVTLKIRVSRAMAARWDEFVGGRDAGRALGALLSAVKESEAIAA